MQKTYGSFVLPADGIKFEQSRRLLTRRSACVASVIVGLTLLVYISTRASSPVIQRVQSAVLVGGDGDVHGCRASAGYEWCEAKQSCFRSWEDPPCPTGNSPRREVKVIQSSRDLDYRLSTAPSIYLGEIGSFVVDVSIKVDPSIKFQTIEVQISALVVHPHPVCIFTLPCA